MEENFNAIARALQDAGLQASAENAVGKPVDFKITPYSLNTKLSFRFSNLTQLKAFLGLTDANQEEERLAKIQSAFMDLGLNPEDFFYVNFFEKGKELEM